MNYPLNIFYFKQYVIEAVFWRLRHYSIQFLIIVSVFSFAFQRSRDTYNTNELCKLPLYVPTPHIIFLDFLFYFEAIYSLSVLYCRYCIKINIRSFTFRSKTFCCLISYIWTLTRSNPDAKTTSYLSTAFHFLSACINLVKQVFRWI